MTEQPIKSKYWLWHLCFIAIWPLAVVLGMIYLVSEAAAGVLYLITAFILFVAAWGSLIGYWVEADRLKQAEADWVPNKVIYIIGHIIFSPFIVAPIYFIRRSQKLGVPWHQTPNGYK